MREQLPDPLGQQGRMVSKTGATEIWARQLANGDLAVALFNRSDVMSDMTVYWAVLGIQGKHKLRDLWRQTSLGSEREAFSTEVQGHGAMLLRIAR